MIAADSALAGNDEGASTRPGGGTGRQDGIAHCAGPERPWPTLSSGGVGIGDCGERRYASGRDVCPDTGLARLSYDQARDLLDTATAADGPGTGWDLHELRHSGLTHLGEAGASLLELMAKSRHRKAENLRRYFKPSPQAMRELTSILGPGAERRR
ncbi:hypothetical protein [Nocardia sp. CS682]|uniref:hypothetical protein n=1 Tax=Nocardia sp. CS682 TaxID=1047172 RepID=UPI001F0F53DD|nr:hypothetical protein [Nocardia sp. CS682]